MTGQELQRLTRLWQKRLRLQDWTVTAVFLPPSEMPSEDTLGTIPFDSTEMTATLKVSLEAPAIEATVVHELLHLRLIPFSVGDPDEPSHDEREQAINLLADCYVKAYPKRQRRSVKGDIVNLGYTERSKDKLEAALNRETLPQ